MEDRPATNPEWGAGRLSIEWPGEELTEAEASHFDPPATPVQEAEFQAELERIRDAEQATQADHNIILG